MESIENIKRYLSEIQMLKRLKHDGVRLAAVEHPDSLAEHAALSAQIAYILGEMEGIDGAKCALINLFHDNHETRIGDHNKVSSRYLDTKAAEKQVEEEQFSLLPGTMSNNLMKLQEEKHLRNTKEGIVAQDADWLEVALQAKIYLEEGHAGCRVWLINVEKALETESAKKILDSIKNDPDFINCWWQDLQKMTYKKLTNN